MINRYYKVFELLKVLSLIETEGEMVETYVLALMYDGELFPSKAAIKRRLDEDINDSTREFVIHEVIAISN